MTRATPLVFTLLMACAPPATQPPPAVPSTDSEPAEVQIAEPPPPATVEEVPIGRSEEAPPAVTTREDGLEWVDIAVGSGDEARPGRRAVMHYDGTLEDGTAFDSSRQRGRPFEVLLGKGMLIRGFEEGVTGMREGGLRRITIPPELGYGERGVGNKVPPNAVLIFEVELLEVKRN